MKAAWELAPWYRQNFTIFGAEGEEDGDTGAGDGGDGADGDGDGSDDDGDADGDLDKDTFTKEELAELRKAVREERAARKKLEKEKTARERAEARAKGQNDDALKQTQAERDEAATKLQNLQAGFLRTRLDAAIEKQARELKFIDPDDAIASVDRSLIDYDQDEDDPSKVTIETDTVKDAVKKLVKLKPHFIAAGTNDGAATGSRGIGGTGKQRKGETTEEAFRLKYPAL